MPKGHWTRRRLLSTAALAAATPDGAASARGAAVAPRPGVALGRPHTDFVQAQAAPIHDLPASGSKPGAQGHPLSYDAKGTRAVSILMRFPPNWIHRGEHWLDSDEELLVLQGSIRYDDVEYGPGDYALLPAGFVRREQRSERGAIAVVCYDGRHKASYATPPPGTYRPERLIARTQSAGLPWTAGTDDDVLRWGPSARRRPLRHEPERGESTWLLRVDAGPRDAARAPVVCEAVEEMLVLEGSVSGPQGTMQPGAYAWRVPGTILGPHGTSTGFVALMRSLGGPLRARRAGPVRQVPWDAAYAPAIPDDQREWAFRPFDGTSLF